MSFARKRAIKFHLNFSVCTLFVSIEIVCTINRRLTPLVHAVREFEFEICNRKEIFRFFERLRKRKRERIRTVQFRASEARKIIDRHKAQKDELAEK